MRYGTMVIAVLLLGGAGSGVDVPAPVPTPSSFALFEWTARTVNAAAARNTWDVSVDGFGRTASLPCGSCGAPREQVVPIGSPADETSPGLLTGSVCASVRIKTAFCTKLIADAAGQTAVAAAGTAGKAAVAAAAGAAVVSVATGCWSDKPTCTDHAKCSESDTCTGQDKCSFGHWCTDGENCSEGQNCTSADDCSVGHFCTSSGARSNWGNDECTEGDMCSTGAKCTAGDNCSATDECTSEGSCSSGTDCTTGPLCTQSDGCLTSGGLELCSTGANCTTGPNCSSGSCKKGGKFTMRRRASEAASTAWIYVSRSLVALLAIPLMLLGFMGSSTASRLN